MKEMVIETNSIYIYFSRDKHVPLQHLYVERVHLFQVLPISRRRNTYIYHQTDWYTHYPSGMMDEWTPQRWFTHLEIDHQSGYHQTGYVDGNDSRCPKGCYKYK